MFSMFTPALQNFKVNVWVPILNVGCLNQTNTEKKYYGLTNLDHTLLS